MQFNNKNKGPLLNKFYEVQSDKYKDRENSFSLEFFDFQNITTSQRTGKKVFIIEKKDFPIFDKPTYLKSNFNISIVNINKSYIYSSLDEVQNLISQKKKFLFVNEEYLKINNYRPNDYKGKEVILYESENKKFLIFPSETENINILEIYKNYSNLTQENVENQNNENNISLNNIISDQFPNNNKKEITVKSKEMILKSLILLYAFEEHFLQLMNSPITIESDIREYYLINKKWEMG